MGLCGEAATVCACVSRCACVNFSRCCMCECVRICDSSFCSFRNIPVYNSIYGWPSLEFLMDG